jgi:hypothetical protein
MAKQFPKEVYLHIADTDLPEDDQWFSVDERPEDFADLHKPTTAAVYKLVEVVVVTTRTTVNVRKSRTAK